jgi:hypothetical protein
MYRDDEHFCGGHCVLRLAMRQRTSSDPYLEARAVYAYLDREEQPDAILRAMSWDSKSVVRKSRDDPPPDAPFTIPAKFVRVPIAQVRQWIKVFDGLPMSLQVFPLEDDSTPICSLRVETNYVSNAFEKVWQVLPGEQSEFLRAWQEVWHEMGNILQASLSLTNVAESFPHIEGKPERYDLQAYKPVLTLP